MSRKWTRAAVQGRSLVELIARLVQGAHSSNSSESLRTLRVLHVCILVLRQGQVDEPASSPRTAPDARGIEASSLLLLFDQIVLDLPVNEAEEVHAARVKSQSTIMIRKDQQTHYDMASLF